MKKILFIGCLAALFFVSCSGGDHFIKEKSVREKVKADLHAKMEAFPESTVFDILFSDGLTGVEREALEFLYAYMPIGDIADYPGEYHLANYRLTAGIREAMPWGMRVPDDLFRHFVLPVRVNNEALDDAREVFYGELADRVRDLSMTDAVLEVNHWCHEKVTYVPTDARTNSPLATVRTATGRCGEESTFLVAALRAVGIPARQIYTPRWAHTDDNHAWVEAWVDGTWHFLGACEPEPVLDLGWFNAPASRGMLMVARVFGRYEGREEILNYNNNITEVNVTANYAATAPVNVHVTDGAPVEGAKVEFKIYNYGEFYPVATKYTDASGNTSVVMGLGDVLVWASAKGKFGFAKATAGQEGGVTIELDKTPGYEGSIEVDIVPPPESSTLPEVTAGQRAENDRRFAEEDEIRKSYMATFPTEEEAKALAAKLGRKNGDLARLFMDSKGNRDVIEAFLTGIDARDLEQAEMLLSSLTKKDLVDVTAEVLEDNMQNSAPALGSGDARHLLCPRVSTEKLVPYKGYFKKNIPAGDAAAWQEDPSRLVSWCADSISLLDEYNAQRIPVTPIGVWEARCADEHSRDIFFVSVARALGIPAWIDQITGKVKYSSGGRDHDVVFSGEYQPEFVGKGRVEAAYEPVSMLENPKYFTHFTLSKVQEDGTLVLQNYSEEDSWESLLKNGTDMEAGPYMLVTGTRLSSGSVLASLTFFNVAEGETASLDMRMRESTDGIRVIGSFDSESLFLPAGAAVKESILTNTGRGYFIVGVIAPGQEPTDHALRDISAKKTELEEWGRPTVLLFGSEADYRRFDPAGYPGLPETVIYGIDDGSIREQICRGLELHDAGRLPLFIIGDTFNRVVFFSQGYTIGLGEELVKVIRSL